MRARHIQRLNEHAIVVATTLDTYVALGTDRLVVELYRRVPERQRAALCVQLCECNEAPTAVVLSSTGVRRRNRLMIRCVSSCSRLLSSCMCGSHALGCKVLLRVIQLDLVYGLSALLLAAAAAHLRLRNQRRSLYERKRLHLSPVARAAERKAETSSTLGGDVSSSGNTHTLWSATFRKNAAKRTPSAPPSLGEYPRTRTAPRLGA
eukprot:5877839-Prymnesium_polylepis.1